MAQNATEGVHETQDIGTWQNPATNWNSVASAATKEGCQADKKKSAKIIVDSKDTDAWPSIGLKGEKDGLCNPTTAQLQTSGSMMTSGAASVLASNQEQTGALSDNATSNSVIHSTSVNSQDGAFDRSSSEKPWSADSSSTMTSGWDGKQNPNQPNSSTASGNSQFMGWGQSAFPSSMGNNNSASPKWGSSANSAQSMWGSQSPSLSKQQASATSNWGMPSANSSASQWANSDGGDANESWGQPNQLANTGADGWGAPTSQFNPSTSSSKWGQPPATSQGTAVSTWPTSTASQPVQKVSSAATASANTASGQWGAISSAGQSSTTSPTTSASNAEFGSPPATETSPTSWAGAAAKGLPKPPPKPVEPVDPVQQQIEASINNPDGWGRVPIRQDTHWGKPPEKKKQDDSNQWQAAPNNGTAIWEAAKNPSVNKWEDKSTWNQKVAGNNDPNVWNGEGSKGKDNALWDDVPASKEPESIQDPTNTWNPAAQPPIPGQPRSASQSSGGDTPDAAWSAPPPNRSSPPSLGDNPGEDGSWSVNGDGKPPNWGGPLPSGPPRGGPPETNAYWGDQPPPKSAGWNSQNNPESRWSSSSQGGSGGSWGQQSNGTSWGGDPQPGWNNRKPWEESGGGDGHFRDRRSFKSESDSAYADDADMGDWNESNSVWSSAAGFKRQMPPPQGRHGPIPENPMPPSMNKLGPYSSNSTPTQTRNQMVQHIMGLGFSKDEALRSLIANDMNLQSAISDLYNNNGHYMPPGDRPFNHMVPPMQNTPFNNNAQLTKNVPVGARTGAVKHNSSQPHPMGRSSSAQQQQQQNQQRMIVHQLQLGVRMGNIHPNILNLPLTDKTLLSIQQLLTHQQQYQQLHDNALQMRNRGHNQQAIENTKQQMHRISVSMKAIQSQLLPPQGPGMSGDNSIPDHLSNLSLLPNTGNTPQSRLSQWKKMPSDLPVSDKAPGGRHLHPSHSTPNLQGGMLGENNTWSNAGNQSGASWSNMSSANQFLDSRNESQSSGPVSFDIPEFIPGQPWQGTSNKVEDDPNMTPGSVAKSLSVSTSGRSSTDLGWSSSGASIPRSTWSTGGPASPGGDNWGNHAMRPPPGFNKNINRSISMPHGPTEKVSAFSPVGSSWDSAGGSGSNSNSTWLVLRNLTPQIDGATLKTLCLQHGPLHNFFVNQHNGQALVQYSSRAEGLKAQKSLNSCVLGNTTIMAEFVEENEVQRIIDQCQRHSREPGINRSNSMTSTPSGGLWPMPASTSANLWGNNTSSNSTWGSPNLLDSSMTSGLLPTADYLANNEFSM